MAPFAGKRKRVAFPGIGHLPNKATTKSREDASPELAVPRNPQANITPVEPSDEGSPNATVSIQIVTGSYERVLHGLSATIPPSLLENVAEAEQVAFAETFLFEAHASSIRCLAISPPTDNDKRFLATGGSDERVNLHSLSTVPPSSTARSLHRPSLTGSVVAENAGNRSLGRLIHHDRAITRLHFPAKSKLFTAAEDNTVAISRTRDWTLLSSIKAPIPKPQGRPSGDTAAPGDVPAGVNDFAIHPSQKLMLTVGRGERSMRLWNLMTGKKAGVLNFDRHLLAHAGEGRHAGGEGRHVLWDGRGENFVVGFERGAVLFGLDSEPRAVLKPSPPTKMHRFRFVPASDRGPAGELLAISTEDGRILFFGLEAIEALAEPSEDGSSLPTCPSIAQLGGKSADLSTRIKDFEIIPLPVRSSAEQSYLIVSAGSDGVIRLWTLGLAEFTSSKVESQSSPKQVGRLIATHETTYRITCLGAFIMDGKRDGATEDVAGIAGEEEEEEEDDDED